MALGGIRGATCLRIAWVLLLALGPAGGLATPEWAAPAITWVSSNADARVSDTSSPAVPARVQRWPDDGDYSACWT